MATYEDEVKKACENCKGLFPESKIQLHEAYCLRNIKKCPHCTEYIDKREMEEHNEEFHKKVSCDKCGQSIENQTLLQAHLDKECRLRPRQCPYCDVKIPVQEFEQHQYICGCRTKICGLCKKNILVRDYELHMDTCVGIVEEPALPVHKVPNQKPSNPSENSYPQYLQKGSSSQNQAPSGQAQASLNNVLKNDREKELLRKAEEATKKRAEEDAKKKLYEEEQRSLQQKAADANRNKQNISSQQQKDALNKPASQYPSYSNQIQQQAQRFQNIPPSSVASNNLDKNKITNEIKPSVPISNIGGVNSIGNKYQNVSSNQPSQAQPTRPIQPEINRLDKDKYGIKPPSSQGQRQPSAGNRLVNQAQSDTLGINKAPNFSSQPQQYPQQQQSSNQFKSDDIYGGAKGIQAKNDVDPYGRNKIVGEEQQLQVNKVGYNGRSNQQPSSSSSVADKYKKEQERLQEQNDLPTQGYYDNLKTMKAPFPYDYKLPETSSQQQKSANQQPTSIPTRVNPSLQNEYKPSSIPSSQYPSNKPSSQYPYSSQTSSTTAQQQQQQQQYQQQQYSQPMYSAGGQNLNDPKQKYGLSNQAQSNAISSQQKNIPTSNISSKPASTKPSYEANQGLNKNYPPGYKKHDEILKNVPSQQGISGIPNYQPVTKQGVASYQPSSGQSKEYNQPDQRIPSRGQVDNTKKPSYPSSSNSNSNNINQQKPKSNSTFNDLEEDTELQKAIQTSLKQAGQRPPSQSQQSQQLQQPQYARQSSNKAITTANQKPSFNPPVSQNKPTSQNRIAGGVDNDEEEMQRAIMESMKQNQQKKGSGNTGVQQKQNYGQYGNYEDEEMDEEIEKAIMMSYKQK